MADEKYFDGVAELLRGRRTIHSFKPDLPPREVVIKGIELARWAPNHGLTEPWHFYLLGRETAMEIVRLNSKLLAERKGPEAGEEKFRRWSAIPGWMVVTCDKSEDSIKAREDYAATCCAIHNFSLYLWSCGIGVKWSTGPVTRDEGFYDLIWADPNNESVVGLLWYGYAAETPSTPRKPLGDVLVELP